MFAVSTEPIIAFVDTVKTILSADATLSALVTGIYGHLSETAAVAKPYLVLGQRTVHGEVGAMQTAGNKITLQLDGWSDAKGPFEIETIGARVYALLERRPGFSVPGVSVMGGSLHREYGEYLFEFNVDTPQNSLYRMIQRWMVEIHES